MEHTRYAQVAFPERRPQQVGVFDYAIPKTLDVLPGSAVTVPFKHSEKIGIVVKKINKSSVPFSKIKTILNLAAPVPLLTPEQLELLDWLQSETASSVSTILHAVLPDKPKKSFFPDICAIKKNAPHDVRTLNVFDRAEDEIAYISDRVQQNDSRQIAIICPDVACVEKIARSLPATQRVFLYAGRMSKQKKYDTWKEIFEGKNGIILGTRNALLLPYRSLSSILLVNEESTTHSREDQHPDIDTRLLANRVREQFQASIEYTSYSPTLEAFKQTTENKMNLRWHVAPLPKLKVIDRNTFIGRHQSTLLPRDLADFIQKQSQQTLVLYNRKGLSRIIRCRDCAWEPSCKTCKSTFLLEEKKEGELVCRICQQKTMMPATCPSCGSTRLCSSFPGILAIAKRLQDFLPHKRIAVISKESEIASNTLTADVVVATQYALPFLSWNTIGATVILDFDLSVSFPDYRSSEFALHRIRFFLANMHRDAQLFILTRKPRSNIFTALRKDGMMDWLTAELEDRKRLYFPPYCELIKLTSISPDISAMRQKEAYIRSSVTKIIKQHSLKGSFAIMQAIPDRTPEGFVSLALLRLPLGYDRRLYAQLVRMHTKEWTITQRPLDLLGT